MEMQTPSLLDWLKAKLGAPRLQRYLRFGLAGLAVLAGAYQLANGATSGYLFLGLSLGLFLWGAALRDGEAAPVAGLPELSLDRPLDSTPSPTPLPSSTAQVAAARQASLRLAQWVGGVAAVGLVLIGQWSLDQFRDRPLPGVALIFLGVAVWMVAVHRQALDAWWAARAPALRTLPQAVPELQSGTAVRWRVAGAALALSTLTLLLTPNNNFTLPGRLTWIASLVAWLLAFWDGPISLRWDWRGALDQLWRGEVTIRLTRTLWLLLWVLIISASFRFAKLVEVPVEMTSDHIEKLVDVNDILNNGRRPIFERTNGGREPLGFYLYALVAHYAGTGLTHFTLKVTNAVIGFLTLPLIFLAAREITDDDLTGLLATLAAGLAWWPNSISRNGLRFPLAPFFAALALWLLIRALKRRERNSALLAGLAMGVGLYGYTPTRILPVGAALALGVYALHVVGDQRRAAAVNAARWLAMMLVIVL
ncbi:MAG: glycosyltransferase family 39 protein, partial [Anaerolineales bacterium]